MLSRTGSNRKRRHREAAQSQKALWHVAPLLASHRPPMTLGASHLQHSFCPDVPMMVYGMESAALTRQDFHRIEAFHAQSLRKIHLIPSTYYTKGLVPDISTTTNQQLREQTSQPPRTRYIHRAQLKLFGHFLRAPEQSFERNCCFTTAFVYRGGVTGEG